MKIKQAHILQNFDFSNKTSFMLKIGKLINLKKSRDNSDQLGRKISFEKSAMTVSLRLGGGGAPSVAKVDEAFISNVPVSEDTPSLLEDRYWRRAGGVKPK